jgi:sulfhydrogenase subunit beta (sulfur reductase)
MYYITAGKLLDLLNSIQKDYDVFVPVKKQESRFYKRYKGDQAEDASDEQKKSPVIGEVRAFEPLKLFFARARERVADGFSETLPGASEKPLCIVGAKACDMKGFKVQDYVFKEGDFLDPFYIRARDENLIISADCTFAIDTCFCLALEVNPYPTEGFDINLSEISGGFVVEVGSQKGNAIVDGNASLFENATDKHIAERDEIRNRVKGEVKQNIRKNKIPLQSKFAGIIEKNYDSDIWKEEAKTCVECGACNTICPTCHCFLLYDQKDKKGFERLKIWDSCMIKDFALVAAGVNPRPWLWMRLRNRFEKKFDFFPKLAEVYACTGCGRCISACPAKIDIRKVLQRLVENVSKQPV